MKAARLHIKGLKEPIELTEQEGNKVKEIMESGNVKESQVVTVAGTPIRKQDMRYVVFYKLDDDKKYVEVSYDTADLAEFQKELEPYFCQQGDAQYHKSVERMTKDILRVPTLVVPKNKFSKGEVSPLLFYSWEMMERIKILQGKNLSEDEARQEAIKLADEFCVGRLYRSGEEKFLQDKRAIRIDEQGSTVILVHPDKSMPYIHLSNKLHAWRELRSKKEFARSMELKQLAGLAESMTINSDDEILEE